MVFFYRGGKDMVSKRVVAIWLGLALMLVVISPAGAAQDGYGVFSYGGVAEADGRRAELTFRITPDRQVVEGRLNAQAVCEASMRLPSTRITFQGALTLGQWESDGGTIAGAWTGGDYGCDGGKMTNWPENGNISINFQRNGFGKYSVKAVRIGPYGYLFEASGKTYDPSMDLERQGDRQRASSNVEEAVKLYEAAIVRTEVETRKKAIQDKIDQLRKDLGGDNTGKPSALKGYWYEKEDTEKKIYLVFEPGEGTSYRASVRGVVAVDGTATLSGDKLTVEFARDNDAVVLNLVLSGERELQGSWKNQEGATGTLALSRYDEIVQTKGMALSKGGDGEGAWRFLHDSGEAGEGGFKKVLDF